MAGENTEATLSGMFKQVYADKLADIVPASAKLAMDIPFSSRDLLGDFYNQPVKLTRAHGWTVSDSGTAYALNAPEPARSQNAQVKGSSFTMREAIGYTAATRLLKGDNAGARKKAFISGTSYIVENMMETAAFVREVLLLHGQSDVGVLESDPGSSALTSRTITLTKATFIAALWSGMENGYIDVYDTTGATKRNATADFQVSSMSVENRTITITGVPTELDALTTGDKVYLRGTKSAGMLGLTSIVSNAGTMFGINAATYSLWAGNTYSAASGSLVFSKILQALNKPSNRGLMHDYTFYLNPKTWTDSNNDLAALRRYADKAGGMIEQGAQSIQYFSHTGNIELKPHIFAKPGETVGIPKNKFKRIGSTDITFNIPGSNDNFFDQLPDNAGYGLRCFFDQAVFTNCPNLCLLINNIVNSDDA